MSRPDDAQAESGAPPIRVVVCDDSAFMRRSMTLVLDGEPDIDVVGSAATGQEAIGMCRELRPDVLTLDMELPDIDGLDVLAQVRDMPLRVLVVSSSTNSVSTSRAVDALAGGALDAIGKPSDELDRNVFSARLMQTVRDIATGTGRHVRLARISAVDSSVPGPTIAAPLLLIGASTGGPAALDALLGALPERFTAPVIVVQHMPRGFSEPFARRLQRSCALPVREAGDGAPIVPGEVIVASSGRHLHVASDRVFVRDGERVCGMRPSVDVAFMDAATTWGSRVTGIVLTGIGSDGLVGARAIRASGGRVIAQDEASCVIWGMPRAVEEAGLADEVVALSDLPAALALEARR